MARFFGLTFRRQISSAVHRSELDKVPAAASSAICSTTSESKTNRRCSRCRSLIPPTAHRKFKESTRVISSDRGRRPNRIRVQRLTVGETDTQSAFRDIAVTDMNRRAVPVSFFYESCFGFVRNGRVQYCADRERIGCWHFEIHSQEGV